MRPVRVTVNAVGNSQWIPLDYLQNAFAVALAIIPWSTVTGTPSYTVQHTFDDLAPQGLQSNPQISISRSGTTATVTDLGPDGLGHGLSTNDNVIITQTGSTNLDTPKTSVTGENGDLGADITVTGNTTYTYTVANSGPTTATGRVVRLRVFNNGDSRLVTASTRVDGNYAFPPRACRLKVTTQAAGAVDFLVLQGAPSR
jgi:hypothetical protein